MPLLLESESLLFAAADSYHDRGNAPSQSQGLACSHGLITHLTSRCCGAVCCCLQTQKSEP